MGHAAAVTTVTQISIKFHPHNVLTDSSKKQYFCVTGAEIAAALVYGIL